MTSGVLMLLSLALSQVSGFPFPSDAVGRRLRELGEPLRVVPAPAQLTPFRASRDAVPSHSDPTAAATRSFLLTPLRIAVAPVPFLPQSIPDPERERLRLRLAEPPPDNDPPVPLPNRP